MRVVLQRVSKASVKIANTIHGEIDHGYLILLGIGIKDDESDIDWLCNKIINLRIFNDNDCKMNLSVKDVDGSILLISQFTLYGSTKKGNRPSFIKSAKPSIAIPLYESFIKKLENLMNKPIKHGVFGADMQVSLINSGPVTITIDSKNRE